MARTKRTRKSDQSTQDLEHKPSSQDLEPQSLESYDSGQRREFSNHLRAATKVFNSGRRHNRLSRQLAAHSNFEVSLPDLIDLFLERGEKQVGPGKLIVPRDFDFRLDRNNSQTKLSIEVISGHPTFEGELFFKLIPIEAKLTGITMDAALQEGWILIAGFIDLPFKIKR